MITRMKGFFVILGFILLISAVDGAAHVSVVARRAPDAPVVAASPGTATPRSADAEAPSAGLSSPVVLPASAAAAICAAAFVALGYAVLRPRI
jgi:hypothetical protein